MLPLICTLFGDFMWSDSNCLIKLKEETNFNQGFLVNYVNRKTRSS